MKVLATLSLLFASSAIVAAKYKGSDYKVRCDTDRLSVDIVKHEHVKSIHLQHLKDYPDPACKPIVEGSKATFVLKLDNIYQCMVTKVVNQITGTKTYYHRVIIEYQDSTPKESILVKCLTGVASKSKRYEGVASNSSHSSLVKRQAPDFPIDFQEEDEILITGEVTGRAPTPELNVGVRQDGILIDDELNVKPGTPLHMEVSLDQISAEIYGLMVTSMQVTDTRQQSEAILVNGCSVDPFLFENFESADGGDNLRAKFRAFKFPESNFVLFKGTVNVCLDRCSSVRCSNGQDGLGRKKRDVRTEVDPNAVYAISMSTVLKYCEDCGDDIKELSPSVRNIEHPVNHKKGMVKATMGSFGSGYSHAEEAAIGALFQEFGSPRFTNFENSSTGSVIANCVLLFWTSAVMFFLR